MATECSAKPLTIKEIPRDDRPRERLQRYGPEQLATYELLAILVRHGKPGMSALELGRQVLKRVHGSLTELAGRSMQDLTQEFGIGVTQAIAIHAALELGRRAAFDPPRYREPVRNAVDVVNLLGPRLRHLKVEELHVLMLDSQHRVQRDAQLSRGILDASMMHPREVFREAIMDSAAAIVLVHNHPSGDPYPSQPDILATADIVHAGTIVGIPVLDHIVIGREHHVSLAEHRLM